MPNTTRNDFFLEDMMNIISLKATMQIYFMTLNILTNSCKKRHWKDILNTKTTHLSGILFLQAFLAPAGKIWKKKLPGEKEN